MMYTVQTRRHANGSGRFKLQIPAQKLFGIRELTLWFRKNASTESARLRLRGQRDLPLCAAQNSAFFRALHFARILNPWDCPRTSKFSMRGCLEFPAPTFAAASRKANVGSTWSP